MSMALQMKNKFGFVDGSIPCPTDKDPMVHTWKRCNNLVLSWINHSVSHEIGTSIIWVDSAIAARKDLKDRFSQAILSQPPVMAAQVSQSKPSFSTFNDRRKPSPANDYGQRKSSFQGSQARSSRGRFGAPQQCTHYGFVVVVVRNLSGANEGAGVEYHGGRRWQLSSGRGTPRILVGLGLD
ncbi:hypothetical protein V8G54_011616 [Vigna mungo]|uniref:Retrotransposon Copia-like N-terminal domain-containing protein n=1 Tax=Vigna mungo TaxID=3915 RepID=A0AAQ3NRM5_VIGMU